MVTLSTRPDNLSLVFFLENALFVSGRANLAEKKVSTCIVRGRKKFDYRDSYKTSVNKKVLPHF